MGAAGDDRAGRAKLLLVDDEAGHLTMASKILGRHFGVVTANGGEEALRVVVDEQPDLALVDYRMPGLTGNEVLERMAALAPRCLRFLVTGDSDRSTLQEAINRGKIYRFVSKPVAYPSLIEDIRLALDHRRAQEAAVAGERLALAGLTSAIAAHDIRNGLQGLAVVPTYIQLGSKDDLAAAIEATNYAQRVMSDCVEEILAVSRGQVPALRRVPADLAALVEQVVTYEAQGLAARRVVRDIAAGLPPVPVSEAHIRRLLGNLIRNAAQATGEGGVITVRVFRDGADHLGLSVGDNGPGIPEQVRARIFQPFTSTKGAAGTGFGLKMCRDVLSAHHGTLTFTTETGVGTTFLARLPLSAPA